MNEWHPMASAPKDTNRDVLLEIAEKGGISCVAVAHFMPGGHCVEDHPPIDRGWYSWNGYLYAVVPSPTRWMPVTATAG